MMGDFWLARSADEVRDRVEIFADWLIERDDYPVCWKAKRYVHPRTLDQNALINVLYGKIADQTEGEGVVDIRRRCKLHFGVPILRANDEAFRQVYDKVVKPHDYETKLEIMDYLPVTSRMKKDQATEYIETVQRDYAGRGVRFEENTA